MTGHELAKLLLALPDLPVNALGPDDEYFSAGGIYFDENSLWIGFYEYQDWCWGPETSKIYVTPTGINNESDFKKIKINNLEDLKKLRDQSEYKEPINLDWILDWIFKKLILKNKYDEAKEAITVMREFVNKFEKLSFEDSLKFTYDIFERYTRYTHNYYTELDKYKEWLKSNYPDHFQGC